MLKANYEKFKREHKLKVFAFEITRWRGTTTFIFATV